MADCETKDELLDLILYESMLSGAVQVGLHGDARVDGHMSDELEQEIREVLND